MINVWNFKAKHTGLNKYRIVNRQFALMMIQANDQNVFIPVFQYELFRK